MPTWLALGFQDSSSPRIGELCCLHDHVITIIFRVIVLISYIITYMLVNKNFYKFFSEGTFIETIWSIVPALLLVILVLPSIKVLYLMEDIKTPSVRFKVVGHQWYWSYVVPLFKNTSFFTSFEGNISHLLFDSVIEGYETYSAHPRLLGASRDFFIPVNTTSRLLITSTDVIHSFSLPSVGLKVDALPGRINQLFSNPSRLGAYYGQCSEICGSNHSFIPISVVICGALDFEDARKTYLLDLLEDSFSSSFYLK